MREKRKENGTTETETQKGGKFEVSLVEEREGVKGVELELLVWEESINNQREHCFEVEVELWKTKREIEKLSGLKPKSC